MPGYWDHRNEGRRKADAMRKLVGDRLDCNAWRKNQPLRDRTWGPKGIFQDLYRKGGTTAVVDYIKKHIDGKGEYTFTPEVVEKWIKEIDSGFEMPQLSEVTQENDGDDKKKRENNKGNDRQ